MVAKKAAPKAGTKAQPEQGLPKPDKEEKSIEEIAAECIAGRWQTGRERTILLINAGYDAIAVQKEVAKQRSQK